MDRRARSSLLIIAVLGSLAVTPSASSDAWPPQPTRGLTVPVGFAARVFTESTVVGTTLTWGPDTAAGLGSSAALDDHGTLLHGTLLYVGGVDPGNPASVLGCTGCGRVAAFSDEGAPVTPNDGQFVATGLNQVLGIAFGPDETLWVADNANSRGRVVALNDGDGDGFFETQRVVLKNIPNGRHQTNGLTFGPDGMLYVANGNATDNGVHCGPPATASCNPGELKPWSGSIIRVNPEWSDVDLLEDIRDDGNPCYADDGMDVESVLVSPGYRNIYDVDFRPERPNEIWTPMNGSDFPSSSEPLFALDVDNEQICGFEEGEPGEPPVPIYGPVIEDAGFPSCLYDPHENDWPMPSLGHPHPGVPEPQQNPVPEVIAKFGLCEPDEVIRPRAIFNEGHEGTSGATFIRGTNFPPRYRGDLLVAEWGSLWNLNGGEVTGHKVQQFEVNPDGTVAAQREFMSGVLPIDLTFGENGFLYVLDMSGQIYEVRHVVDTADTVAVDMRAGQFVPQAVTLIRGQSVRWCNFDTAPHNVNLLQFVPLQEDPRETDPIQEEHEMSSEGDIAPGQCYSFSFTGAGVYHYNSTTSALDENTMHGAIVVTTLER